MWFGIITLFPEMFNTIIKYGIISRAIKQNKLNIQIWNPRDFTFDIHNTVDDKPYGGGSGMLLMVQPLRDAISAAKIASKNKAKVIYLSPQGYNLTQNAVKKLLTYNKLILVCGRYKGIDERIIQTEIDEELSIGDYVLSGGEFPAMVLIDSVSRLIPGVINKYTSINNDSFSNGLLECPHYTRPAIFENNSVPSVLLSGNHENIRCWRIKQSLGRTWIKKPELLKKITLNEEQKKLLEEFKCESK